MRRALAMGLLLGCGCVAPYDFAQCGETECFFGLEVLNRLRTLSPVPEPPPDSSNKVLLEPKARALGKKLYFDGRFSGPQTSLDTLRRPMPYSRSNVSCASCHDLSRAGTDPLSVPGHVSVGTGWYDVNSQPTVNAAFGQLYFWNGRSDSLWAQAFGSSESAVAMNGNRLKTAWLLRDLYRAEYEAVFTGQPLPMPTDSAAVRAMVEPNGTCRLSAGACPPGCREVANVCWPRFPLEGKPGNTPGCQPLEASEPFGDAFDCMEPADRTAITRVGVNYGKAIHAFEQQLVSRDAPFDRFIAEGGRSRAISESARRGARLFAGAASCMECHHGPLFTDGAFHNVAVPQVGTAVPTVSDCGAGNAVCDCTAPRNCLPFGWFDGLTKLKASPLRRDGPFGDDPADTSRKKFFELEPQEKHKGAWKTPGLRDVELTAPYMHDGVFQTLEEVVAHYNRGGSTAHAGTRDVRVTPLGLSAGDEADLVEFLKTLTGAPLSRELTTAPVLP